MTDHMTDHMTSTKNSHGFPMAILKDCRLSLSSCGTAASSRLVGGILHSLGVPRRMLAKLAVSVSLPLPTGLPDFLSDLLLSFLLPPEALLPVNIQEQQMVENDENDNPFCEK